MSKPTNKPPRPGTQPVQPPHEQSAPLISVILPVRDAEATLASALRSVARQRFRRFECLVVDDGSR
ncbi:MAG: glycosyltransferase, partial [Myxococcales bacterium]|nr:glycosyltransferase [Myxococcales bacterium]